MIAALNASGEEDTMTWFTPMLGNWVGFAYLGNYLSYVLWLFVLVILVHPFAVAIYCIYIVVNLLLCIYKKKNNIQEGTSSNSWDKAKQAVAYTVNSLAKMWHGYEVIGMEHLAEGPGLIIFYHGALSVDYMYFLATLYRQKGRLCHTVSEYILMQVPGIKLGLEISGSGAFNKAECVELLKKGHLVGIAPGGLREQNFSDQNYTLFWGNRMGFAKVALEAKVPIIPIFTQNTREAYWTVGKTRLTRWLYERYRWISLPVYGGLPVKLRTYIGEPIPYDPNISAKELAEKAKTAMENLIDQHQKKPGNKMRALLERFDKHHKES